MVILIYCTYAWVERQGDQILSFECVKQNAHRATFLFSQKWLTCNLLLKYPYIVQQTADENTQTNQVEFFILM